MTARLLAWLRPGVSVEADSSRVRLSTPGVGVTALPFLPDSEEITDLADVWVETAVPGRRPGMHRAGRTLAKHRLVASLADVDGRGIGWLITEIESHAASAQPTTLLWASRVRGQKQITELSVSVTDWDDDGDPLRAEVSMLLAATSEHKVNTGPVKKRKTIKADPPKLKGRVKGAVRGD